MPINIVTNTINANVSVMYRHQGTICFRVCVG